MAKDSQKKKNWLGNLFKKKGCECGYEKDISADASMIIGIIVFLLVSVVAAGLVYVATCIFVPDGKISAGILRDINILFISVNATLIGLYVAGFIFLNDSLKTRVNEDPTLRNAVKDIMATYRKIMFIVALCTGISILSGVVNNIVVGEYVPVSDTGSHDYENTFLSFKGLYWLSFLLIAGFSAGIMVVIIYCSSKITNSDQLIVDQSKRELERYNKRIEKELSKFKENHARSKKTELSWDEENPNAKEIYAKICEDLKRGEHITSGYSIEAIYNKVIKESEGQAQNEKGIDDKRVQFTKLVRAIELIVAKICDNNIDQSVQGNDFYYKSIEEGFVWLYVEGQVRSQKNIIDIRDENRFFDYVKYKILNAENLIDHPFANDIAEEIFKDIKEEYRNIKSFKAKKEIIADYKQSMRQLIKDFFTGYNLITSFRNAIEHYYSAARRKKDKKDPIEEALMLAIPYAEALKRVLIDRFTSFVKTDNINLGNTMMPESWFNYSELSNSNFTHSSFEGAHIENAIVKNCDLSISSLIRVDATDTDFSNSNFNFSNLTGVDLRHAILDGAQLNSVLLRDSKMDDVVGWGSCLFHKEGRDYHAPKEEKFFDNATLTNCHTLLKEKSDWESGVVEEGSANVGVTTASLINMMKPPKEKTSGDNDKNSFARLWNTDETKILSHSSIEGNLLKNTYEDVKSILKGVLDAHKYSKISNYLYQNLEKALEYEKYWEYAQGENEPRPSKEHRIATYGKINFEVAKLDSASIENVSMRRIDFSYVSMENTSFKSSDLTGAEMYYTNANAAEFGDAKLNALDAYRANFSECSFHQTKLINALFLDCNMSNANFAKAVMMRTALIHSRDGEAEIFDKPYLLRYLELVPTAQNNIGIDKYEKVNDFELYRDEKGNEKRRSIGELEKQENGYGLCVDSNFTEILANEIFLININANRALFKRAVLKQGVFYNSLIRWSTFEFADISNGIFIGNSFHQTSFAKATLSRAAFCACEFSNGDLSCADLISCRMKNVIFEEANLRNCNLAGANIEGGIFRSCAMSGINVTGATFTNVTFVDIDFSEAIGLSDATFKNCTVAIDNRDCDGGLAPQRINLREATMLREVVLHKDSVEEDEEETICNATGNMTTTYSSDGVKASLV